MVKDLCMVSYLANLATKDAIPVTVPVTIYSLGSPTRFARNIYREEAEKGPSEDPQSLDKQYWISKVGQV